MAITTNPLNNKGLGVIMVMHLRTEGAALARLPWNFPTVDGCAGQGTGVVLEPLDRIERVRLSPFPLISCEAGVTVALTPARQIFAAFGTEFHVSP